MNELKPCPFCGDSPRIRRFELMEGFMDETYSVRCDFCGASIDRWLSNQDAIAAWNRRTPTNTGEDTTAGAIRQSGEEGR